MNNQEKLEFIDSLIIRVKTELVKDIYKVPEEWDGIELRWLIRERFQKIVLGGQMDRRERRYKDYHNHVLISGL